MRVGNDANVAALGEMWKGGAVGYHNVVMVTLGTGVGGGIIINGKIVMKNREVLTLDEERIRFEAEKHMNDIIKRAY